MAVRTFIALDLDDAILDELEGLGDRLDDGRGKIRWVARENLHVTLRFLGEVGDELVAEVCSRAARAAGRAGRFDYDVAGLTCVPPSGPLRMLWAGILDVSGKMSELHDLLEGELADLGLHSEDRRFKPHLTLARIAYLPDARAFRQAAEAHKDRLFGTQQASEIVVYSSKLTPSGPVYSPMSRASLEGPG